MAKTSSDAPQDLASMYVTIFLIVLAYLLFSQRDDALGTPAKQEDPNEKSAGLGIFGAFLILAVVVGTVVGYRALSEGLRESNGIELKDLVFDRMNYVYGNTSHKAINRPDEWYFKNKVRKQRYWEPSVRSAGLAGLVMGNRPGFRELQRNKDHSFDPYRHAENELLAYRSRKEQDEEEKLLRETQEREDKKRASTPLSFVHYNVQYPIHHHHHNRGERYQERGVDEDFVFVAFIVAVGTFMSVSLVQALA